MGRRISKEFLHPSILEGVNNKIGNLDSLETDAKGNMVQAINELVEKLDNNSAEIEAKEAEIAEGKELIANAVGEPLTADDTFSVMSDKIIMLINNFKNMLEDSNINVDSSDGLNDLLNKVSGMNEFLVTSSIPDVVYENTLIIIDENPSDNSNIYLYENTNCQEGDILIDCLSNGETGIKLSSGKLENILCVKSVKKKVGEEFIELQCYYYYKEAYRTLDYEDIVFDKDNQTVHAEWKLANSCAGGYSIISNNQIQVHGACERNGHAHDCTATFTSQKFYEYSKLRLKFSTSCSDNVITIQIKDAYTDANIISKTYGSGTFDVVYEANKPFYLYVYSPGAYNTSSPTRIYSTTINIDSISVMKN